MRPTLLVVGGLLVVAVGAVAIALIVNSEPGPSGDIQATTTDFKITMPTVLKSGKHTIGLTNSGKVLHELVMFKTDLPADKLPTNAAGDVDEESPSLSNVADSGEPLKAGSTRSFKTEALDPGHYVAVCNLPGHYRLGMELNVTVK
ncbi:MAG: hypothetical protein ACHQIG_02895 [Acidimicrobiia bacterium]